MTFILLMFCFIIEGVISYLLIKGNFIQTDEIKNILRPLNITISLITIISWRFLKQNEWKVNNDIKLVKGFMEFFEIAHGRPSSWKSIGRSEQIAAIFALSELGKRHEILKNISKNWLKDITERNKEDTIKEIKEAAEKALDELNR